MDLSTAIANVNSSIDAYRNVSSWIPNDDSTDNLLKTALDNKNLTWAGLGAVCASRSARMAYLQDPIESLQKPFEDTLGMQFATGTVGWWFTYGMDDSGKYGWLIIVFRYPTTGNSQQKSTGDTAVFNVGGYIVSEGVRYPLSTDGNPLTCSGTYIANTDTDTSSYTIVLTSTDFDSNAMISDFTITAMDNGFLQVGSTFVDGGSLTIQATSKHSAVPHGDSNGCAPCAAGVGTNYWSWTYMPGQMQYSPADGTGDIVNVTGWFDHQWAVKGVAPRGFLPQVFATLSRFFSAGSPARWIWFTLVLDENLQYSCNVLLTQDDVLQEGAEFSNETGGTKYSFDDDGNPTMEYGLPVTVKINSVLADDPVLSRNVTVTVENTEYTLQGIVADGFVTLENGTINQEVPCFVHDSDDAVVGHGFLEMNQMHSAADNATDTLQVMGLEANKDNLDVLLPRKYSFSQAWPSVMIVVAALLLVLTVVGLMVWGLVILI